MGTTEIKLTLTLDEVNNILGALGNISYVQVKDLIEKVRNQAIPQAQAAEAANPQTVDFKEVD
jgi:hypothetical protein